MPQRNLLFSIITSAVILFGIPACIHAAAPYDAADVAAAINTTRAAQGKKPLAISSQLTNAAAQKAADMISKDYFSHTGPDGATPWAWIQRSGYSYTRAAENLARGFSTPTALLEGWMASQGHRDNILADDFTDCGIAVVEKTAQNTTEILIVVEFGAQKVNNMPNISKDTAIEPKTIKKENQQPKTEEMPIKVEKTEENNVKIETPNNPVDKKGLIMIEFCPAAGTDARPIPRNLPVMQFLPFIAAPYKNEHGLVGPL